MRVPQAIFTSLRGKRLDGYQLAARSDEIDDDLARELQTWGPAHDSLHDPRCESINFHPVMSEAWYCLSRTVCSGAEYSGRSGGRIYTQMFLLPPEGLARFANNPFLVLRALRAAGRLVVFADIPQKLRSLRLVGRAVENQNEPDESELPAEALSALADALRNSAAVAVHGGAAEPWFSALFDQLTPDVRRDTSFSTGLKPTMGRPFKLFVAPKDPAQQRQLGRQSGVRIVTLPKVAANQAAHA